jgi:hypothetical protein
MANPESAPSQTQHDEIAEEAFRIWCDEGRPEGRADENWRQAEFRLAARTAGKPVRPDRSAAPSRRGFQPR